MGNPFIIFKIDLKSFPKRTSGKSIIGANESLQATPKATKADGTCIQPEGCNDWCPEDDKY